MGAKTSVLGLIMSFLPYLRSAMVRFPFFCQNTAISSLCEACFTQSSWLRQTIGRIPSYMYPKPKTFFFLSMFGFSKCQVLVMILSLFGDHSIWQGQEEPEVLARWRGLLEIEDTAELNQDSFRPITNCLVKHHVSAYWGPSAFVRSSTDPV